MSRQILVVEDDLDISQLLAVSIGKAGFGVQVTDNGHKALELIRSRTFDLVVLDLMIPGIDGFEVCKQLRRDPETAGLPVLILTARVEEIDRIVGLELGADDYVVKPFSPRELILRIRAILRRIGQEHPSSSTFRGSGLEMEFEAHRVAFNGREISLTATEFKLLSELVQNQGKVLTREQLLEKVWGYTFEGYSRTVDTHIRRLRHKLMAGAEYVETVRGIGYRFRG